jgi:branched-chain amino acid transport system permease protein
LEVIAEVLIFGFLISSLYALVSVGFSMIFGAAGVLNLAHGAMAMFAAYIASWAIMTFGVGFLPAAVLGVIGVALISPILYLVVIRPLGDKPVVVFLATLLLGVIFEQAMILAFGFNARVLPPIIKGGFTVFGDIRILYNRALAGAVAVILIGLLWLFITRTKYGKAILGISMSAKGAALSGIQTNNIILLVWAISGALAAIAGLFSASFLGVSPLADREFTVIAFSTVVLGGLGSLPGSLLAAFIIGYVETITVQFAPEARGLASLAILIIVLILRPQGLFGRAHE